MSRFNPHHNSQAALDSAAVWRSRCLLEDRSIFLEGAHLWTPTLLDELDRQFVQNLDGGEGDFFEKLEGQLAPGSSECRRLMAEALWILLLFQTNVRAATKRENIRYVWSLSGQGLPADHPFLTDDVLGGIGSAGTGYNTHRWRELSFLIVAVREIKRQTPTERQALLGDSWKFAEWLSNIEGAPNRQLPHVLCHLLSPDSFERISSPADKRKILAAFDGKAEKQLKRSSSISIDTMLLDLRRRLEEERGGSIDFYEPDLAHEWRDKIRSWLLSWNPARWSWATLREDRACTRRGETVLRRWRCGSTEPREGDHAYLVRTGVEPRGIVAFGTVARTTYEAPHYDPARADAGDIAKYIDVEFSDIRDVDEDEFVAVEQLQRDVPDQTWSPQSSGISINPKAARILARHWKSTAAGLQDHGDAQPAAPAIGEPLNLILYGPPGTGKTYRLQHYYIPQYTDGSGDRFEFVTFHQSYAYEDFVEGIRPVTVSGQITYEVRPGVLRRLCDRAGKDTHRRYALFIDEINRGNIAKIFDELITLIEPDKRLRLDGDGHKVSGLEVTLPYSGTRFGVPANLDFIGTMNSADRSIALLDRALRRRFQFEEMMPRSGTIKGSRDGIIPDDEGGEIDLRRLLDTLNARLCHLLHRDQSIGHAYLNTVHDFAGLRRVVARELLPLLQEYFYDDWRQICLVLGENGVDAEHQIVRRKRVKPDDLFSGPDTSEIGESELFDVTPEASITADAIRKIYEAR